MRRILSLLPVVLLMLMSVPSSSAQSGNGYDLSWNVIAGGGMTFSAGDNYRLGATTGQVLASSSSGGNHMLNSGFWNGTIASVSFAQTDGQSLNPM
jgi:hypothetical protein